MSCSRNLCTLYTQNVSHNQQQPTHLWHRTGRGACQDTDEKYDKTLLNHLKILQLTLLFFIRLMKVFRLFGFVSRAAAVAVAARQQTFSWLAMTHATSSSSSREQEPPPAAAPPLSTMLAMLWLSPLCCVWQFHFLFWGHAGALKDSPLIK